jgi:NAD-dependent deacetylase
VKRGGEKVGQDQSIVILTGAGISAESGIQTFRGQDGLWENHRIEEVASPEAFFENPSLVQGFYNQRRASLLNPSVQPNAAHHSLALLEKKWPGKVLVVTQNVDNLHERAGTRNLIHMHGELLKVRCLNTDQVFDWKDPILPTTKCACCGQAGTLRPHIVWFGEIPLEMERIQDALQSCRIFAAIGTSGNVYPAAGFVELVASDAIKIELNVDRSMVSSAFDEHRLGSASKTVPQWVDELLNF